MKKIKLNLKFTDKTKRIIFIFFMIFFLFFLALFPTDVEVITPGVINKVGNLYSMEKGSNNNFYQTAVYAFRRPNFIMRSFLELSSKNKTIKIDTSALSNKEDYEMAKIDGIVSTKSAIVAAYILAIKNGYDVNLDYDITGFYIYYISNGLKKKLSIGKKFTKINGEKITKDFYLNKLNNDYFLNDITLENDKEKITLSKDLLLKNKIFIKPDIKIIKTSPKIEIKGDTGLGPSAGMINAISIYFNLINKKINYKIAGTGTINLLGKIGPIGGIVQKIHTTNKNGMDYFIIPKENYERSYDEINKIEKNLKVKLIVVDSFEQAISKIGEIKWKSLKQLIF